MSEKDRPVLEVIAWKSVSDELPDAGMEVLVCYEWNGERSVGIACYDDFDDIYESGPKGPWYTMNGTEFAGVIMYWAEMPAGPERVNE